MAKEYSRTQRVGDQIQRDLAKIIQQDMKDPRLGLVTISGVRVTRDLAYADVHVTFLGRDGEGEVKEALKVMSGAAGFLRSELARGLKLRIIPKLRFHYDESLVRGRRLSSLIDQAREKDAPSAVADDEQSNVGE